MTAIVFAFGSCVTLVVGIALAIVIVQNNRSLACAEGDAVAQRADLPSTPRSVA